MGGGVLLPNMRDQVETQLVARLRLRDEGALAELSSLYGAKIFQLAFRCVKNREDAEEVVQDVLRDFKGLTTEEASQRLRVKDQTLKSRLHRGRLLLRDRLSDFAGGLSMHRPAEAF